MAVPTFLRFHKGDDLPATAPGVDHEDLYPKADGRWYRRGSDGIEHAIDGVADDDPRLSDARTPTTHGHTIAQVTGLQAALDNEATLARNAANLTGTLPTSVLPPLAINETFVAANQAAMLALVAQRGDMAIRTDNAKTFVLSSDSPGTLADWKEVLAAGQVQSVAGKSGVVALAKGDVGLGSVDNTADSAKPVSTAQATAISSAVSTSETGQVRDGDTAGGVLAGTYPNPTFAADMATQAELDQALTTVQPAHANLTALAGQTATAFGRGQLAYANTAAATAALDVATTALKGLLAAADKKQLDDLKAAAYATPGQTVPATTETVVMSLPLPANSVKVGTTFLVSYAGIPGATSATTMRIRIGPLGTIADPAVLACAGPATATTAVRGEMTAAVSAVGASAAFNGVGAITNAAAVGGTMTNAGTFNSGVANILTVTVQSGTTNTHTVRAGVVQAFNLA